MYFFQQNQGYIEHVSNSTKDLADQTLTQQRGLVKNTEIVNQVIHNLSMVPIDQIQNESNPIMISVKEQI